MTSASRHALLLVAVILGCSAPDHEPSETVRRYLDAMANDPIRTLSLVSDHFHTAHGLRFDQVGDQPFATQPAPTRRFDDDSLELERARLGWLTVLTKRFFAIQSGRFTRSIVGEEIDGDRARVVVRVEGGKRPAFEIPLQLVRGGSNAPWRIDGADLPKIADEDLGAAFLVAPNASLHRRIDARRRGASREPGFEIRGRVHPGEAPDSSGTRTAATSRPIQSGTHVNDQSGASQPETKSRENVTRSGW